MAGTFQIKKSSNDQYYFVLKAPNNEVVLTSETYTTKQSAKNGIEAVQAHGPGAKVEDLS